MAWSRACSSSLERLLPLITMCTRPHLLKEEVAVPTGDLYDLMDLQPRMCRWPSGDPKEEGFGFCGSRTISGIPYCAEHAKLAYQPATRNRLLGSGKETEKTASKDQDRKAS